VFAIGSKPTAGRQALIDLFFVAFKAIMTCSSKFVFSVKALRACLQAITHAF